MKNSPEENQLHKRLEASKFSASGFLGTDKREVDEIIADDSVTLAELGLEVSTIVKVLSDAIVKAKEAYGAIVSIEPNLTAQYFESKGKIPSPYVGEGVFEKGEVCLKDTEGHELHLTALSVHLIEHHSFFQGHGSRYRIDPKLIAAMFQWKA